MKALVYLFPLLLFASCSDESKIEGKWEVFRMKDQNGNLSYSKIPAERERIIKDAGIYAETIKGTQSRYDSSFGTLGFLFANGESSVLENGINISGKFLPYKVDEKSHTLTTKTLKGTNFPMYYTIEEDTLELKFEDLHLILWRID